MTSSFISWSNQMICQSWIPDLAIYSNELNVLYFTPPKPFLKHDIDTCRILFLSVSVGWPLYLSYHGVLSRRWSVKIYTFQKSAATINSEEVPPTTWSVCIYIIHHWDDVLYSGQFIYATFYFIIIQVCNIIRLDGGGKTCDTCCRSWALFANGVFIFALIFSDWF